MGEDGSDAGHLVCMRAHVPNVFDIRDFFAFYRFPIDGETLMLAFSCTGFALRSSNIAANSCA
jgi:hypothetical protein